MKRFRNVLIFSLVLIFVTMCFVGCNTIKSEKVSNNKIMMSADGLNQSLSNNDNQQNLLNFSGNLISNTYKEKENLLISPLSVYLTLGMLTNSTNGETKKEMLDALGGTQEELNAYCGYLYGLYEENKNNKEVSLANSIWYSDSYQEPKSAFLDADSQYYGAEIYKSDFGKNRTVKDINNWVDKKTDGMVDKIIDKIDPLTIMYLVNSIRFEDKWNKQFSSSYERDFTNFDGKKIKADFLSEEIGFYYDNGNAKAFTYSFLNNRFKFVGILPNNDINSYLSEFDGEELSTILDSKKNNIAKIRFPCFSYDYSAVLDDTLKSLGMNLIFENGDFSNGWDVKPGDLKVNDVLHKSFIEVDKNGVKASAVIKIGMKCTSSAPNENPVEIFLNRPFMYGIMDMEYNVPLFIGVCGDIK